MNYGQRKVYICAMKENEEAHDYVIIHVFSSKKLAESYCKYKNKTHKSEFYKYFYYFAEPIDNWNWWE